MLVISFLSLSMNEMDSSYTYWYSSQGGDHVVQSTVEGGDLAFWKNDQLWITDRTDLNNCFFKRPKALPETTNLPNSKRHLRSSSLLYAHCPASITSRFGK
jgi:hypothetical protein